MLLAMATEILNINGSDGGWPTGTASDDAAEAISAADGSVVSTTIDDDVIIFNLDDSALVDGDTITQVDITIRGRTTGAGGKDTLVVDWLIGGAAQGGSASTAVLTTDLTNYALSSPTGGWNSDWTAAELDGAQVQVRANQTGKAEPATWEVDCLDAIITYTPDAGAPEFKSRFMLMGIG